MIPATLDPIIDRQGGFTTLTKLHARVWRKRYALDLTTRTTWFIRADPDIYDDRPALRATYKLSDYCCFVLAWFDSVTHERLD